MKLEALAFGAHPDDAELGCGGLLLKLKDMGYTTGIIDLTEAEMSTNGDVCTRQKETENASKILGLDVRENAGLEDCNIKNDSESRLKIIEIIRKYRPELAIIPFRIDRHPDHENAHKLLKDAIFAAGLSKLVTSLPAYRPAIIICYMLNHQFHPSFIVDISPHYERKMEACKAYKSQFYRQASFAEPTFINSRFFQDYVTGRDKCYGIKIRADYGEPYYLENEIKIDDPLKFFKYLR